MALQIEGVAYLTLPRLPGQNCGLPSLGASHDHDGKAAVSDAQPDAEPLGMPSSRRCRAAYPADRTMVEASLHDCY